MTDFASNL